VACGLSVGKYPLGPLLQLVAPYIMRAHWPACPNLKLGSSAEQIASVLRTNYTVQSKATICHCTQQAPVDGGPFLGGAEHDEVASVSWYMLVAGQDDIK
jgi:hypothetical protein